MNFRMNFIVLVSFLFILTGCASNHDRYDWNDYQAETYDYFKGGDDEKQILDMEKDLEKTKAKNKRVPPGFHAHLGLLYSRVGKVDLALKEFIEEKTYFPESSNYMDFLIKKKGSKEVAKKEAPLNENGQKNSF